MHGNMHQCMVTHTYRPDNQSKTRGPEWRQLKSETRFAQALLCYLGPPSHILFNIKWPFLGIMLVAVAVNLWEYAGQIPAGRHGNRCCFILHLASKPLVPLAAVYYHGFPLVDEHGVLQNSFRLTSFAMSLLLAFRLNRTYDRWKEARSSLSGVVRKEPV